MSFLLNQVFQFIKLLNSDKGTNQIASGIACGFVLGMAPAFSLQTIVMIAVILLFRVQIGAAMMAAGFFKFAAYLLDPAFDVVGQWVLENGSLRPLWTELYHMPIVPFTRFNHSVVMGSGVVSLALLPLLFLASKVLVEKYRLQVVARFEKTKFWKAVQATGFYKWYLKYESIQGDN